MDPVYFRIGSCQTTREATIIKKLISMAATRGIRAARQEALAAASGCASNTQHARAMVCVIADLIHHGWKFRIDETDIFTCNLDAPASDSRRAYVRQIQLGQREQQLLKASIREFVRSMEKARLGPNGWTSIFSLMRDGSELATALRSFDPSQRVPRVIAPYIQVVEDAKQKCPYTGLRLMDIWRYFRYTWAMPYNSVPGRSMLALIRDSAAPNHPIIGIAAFGSAIVQLSPRDKWIGWTSAEFIKSVQQHPTKSIAKWVLRQFDRLLDAVYRADLLKSQVISRWELKHPSETTIKNLEEQSERAWKLHRQFPTLSTHKSQGYTDKHWKEQTLSHLFRAKRCETLARLLRVRKILNEAQYEPTRDGLRRLLTTSAGRRAIEILLRAAKAEHVGIDMLDITICGAVPPYNPILGGKLVAMLLCSPEIARAYFMRYRNAPSIIASSMAGRTVNRPPRLALLGTTSLYGERLNQYHRIQIPEGIGGAKHPIRFTYLGESVGFGSSHLSRETVAELELLLSQSSRGRRVNSIFGEGVSPRLRKIRDGLDALGLPSDRILNHGNPRLVYGIPLAMNFRELLVGLDSAPEYVLPQKNCRDVTKAISQYWCTRWLNTRLENHPQVLDSVEQNDVRLPDRHSARVVLPELDTESAPLFV